MTKCIPPLPVAQVQWAHTMIPPVLAATQAKNVVDFTLYLKGFMSARLQPSVQPLLPLSQLDLLIFLPNLGKNNCSPPNFYMLSIAFLCIDLSHLSSS